METLTLKHAIFSALGRISVPTEVINKLYQQHNEHQVCSVDWKNFLLNRNNTQWRFVKQNIADTTWPNSGNFNLRQLRSELLTDYAKDDATGFYGLLAQHLQAPHDQAALHQQEQRLTEELKHRHTEHPSYRRYLTAILLSADEYSSPYAASLLEQTYLFNDNDN